MKTREFLKALDDAAVVAAIDAAEKRTSGEIRVFVAESEVADARLEAEAQFMRLGMTKTARRNGVLIYFAPLTQSFAVIGDQGVHEKCGDDFWRGMVERMTPMLKEQRFTDAVVFAVQEIGEVLAREFPPQANDRNELPNQVIREQPKE